MMIKFKIWMIMIIINRMHNQTWYRENHNKIKIKSKKSKAEMRRCLITKIKKNIKVNLM